MLTIVLSPSSIAFIGLSDELYQKLLNDYDVECENGKGYKITGVPHYLYKVLLQLSYDYDLEIM